MLENAKTCGRFAGLSELSAPNLGRSSRGYYPMQSAACIASSRRRSRVHRRGSQAEIRRARLLQKIGKSAREEEPVALTPRAASSPSAVSLVGGKLASAGSTACFPQPSLNSRNSCSPNASPCLCDTHDLLATTDDVRALTVNARLACASWPFCHRLPSLQSCS
jgi:hypothetical protein